MSTDTLGKITVEGLDFAEILDTLRRGAYRVTEVATMGSSGYRITFRAVHPTKDGREIRSLRFTPPFSHLCDT